VTDPDRTSSARSSLLVRFDGYASFDEALEAARTA
jgi:hypothetical protein